MSPVGVPTLDQLRVFLTVTEEGSFAAAGRRLGRATSVISYAVANLEAQLGLRLFDRASRLTLTLEGRRLLPQARRVCSELDDLRTLAGTLQGRQTAQLRLALDPRLEVPGLVDLLIRTQRRHPGLRVKVLARSASEAVRDVKEKRVELGLIGSAGAERDSDLLATPIGTLNLISVAAPNSGHLDSNGPSQSTSRSTHPGEDEALRLEGDAALWEADTPSVVMPLLRRGEARGFVPAAWVGEDLRAGRLVRQVGVAPLVLPALAIRRREEIPEAPIVDLLVGLTLAFAEGQSMKEPAPARLAD